MHLIAPLAAGMNGAESGSAQLFIRGTTTRAQWYEDFVASTTVAAGTDITLDEHGAAEVYVRQLVDVVVFDAQGEELRRFTAGDYAANVEVISKSFTGADYEDATEATSLPTELLAVLDKWLDSAGAPDWKVLIDGTARPLTFLAGILSGLFYNVKSAAYGAVGDGVADDTTTIQAAITAAAVNGGIVIFPPGSYRITAALSVPAKVSLWGVSSSSSLIKMDHASNGHIAFSGASSEPRVVRDLGFTRIQNGNGNIVDLSVGASALFETCAFGDGFTQGHAVVVGHASAQLRMRDCAFQCQSANNQEFILCTDAAVLEFSGCTFIWPSNVAASAAISAVGMTEVFGNIRDCKFNYDAVATFGAGHNAVVIGHGAGDFGVFDCLFTEPTATATACIDAQSVSNVAGAAFYESGNTFGDSNGTHWPAYVVWSASNADSRRGTLRSRMAYPASLAFAAGTTTFDTCSHGYIHLPILGAGNRTVKLTEPMVGDDVYVVINNRHVAAVQVTFSANNMPVQMINPLANLASNSFWAYHFRVTKDDGGTLLQCISALQQS